MSDKTLYPNTFQSPNTIIDDGIMALLDGNEVKCLFACQRKILGWESHRITKQDRISLTQLEQMTGLGRPTVKAKMDELQKANLVKQIDRGHGHTGALWELNMGQLGEINMAYLTTRGGDRMASDAAKMSHARTFRGETDAAVNGINQLNTLTSLWYSPEVVNAISTSAVNGINTQNLLKLNKLNTTEGEKASPSAGEAPPPTGKEDSWAWITTIGEVCKMDPKLNNRKIGGIAKKLREAGYNREQIVNWYSGDKSWWWSEHWRGRDKHQPPTPEQIVVTIAEAKGWWEAKRRVARPSTGGNIPMIGGNSG